MSGSNIAAGAARRLAALAGLLLVLGGCGAGVVGTGSGKVEDGAKGIPNRAANLCAAPFAQTALACPRDGDGSAGTAPVHWIDGADATVQAALDRGTLGLSLPCREMSFLGTWAELDDGTQAFVGIALGPTGADVRPALVHVLPASDRPGAVGWLELLDASGDRLAGPWLVHRAETPAGAARCLR